MRKLLLVLIIVPVIVTSIVGLFSLLSFSAKLTAQANAEIAYANATGITALVGEYTAFLTAAAELDTVKAAAEKSEAGKLAEPFLSAYAESESGVYDILITNSQGFVFSSCLGQYSSSETFRDTPDLINLAPSPTPVSGFYEDGRFYCAKPVRNDKNSDKSEIIGYIILVTDSDLIPDYVRSKTETALKGGKGVFAVFDENGYTISTESEISMVLKNSIDAHSDRIQPADDLYELFEQSRRFGAAGNIDGTKWRWISLYPITAASPSAFDVFIVAFDISAGICLINVIIMLIITRKHKKEDK